MSRESDKNLPVFCKWYNSIPFLFSVKKKKNTSTIWRKFFTKMYVQMVSALSLIRQKATLHVQHTSFVHFFAVGLTNDVKLSIKYTF